MTDAFDPPPQTPQSVKTAEFMVMLIFWLPRHKHMLGVQVFCLQQNILNSQRLLSTPSPSPTDTDRKTNSKNKKNKNIDLPSV